MTGNPQFRSGRVSAYEVGYRGQPTAAMALSISAYYNHYDDLRSIEPASSTTFLPLYWGNLLAADTYGFELWSSLQITDWWRLSPGFSTVHKRLSFQPGAAQLLGVPQAGDDPSGHASLSSSMDLARDMAFDLALRYVSPLPSPALAGYYDMSARYAWRLSKRLELSLNGANLLHARHFEFPAPSGEQIARSVMLQSRWSF